MTDRNQWPDGDAGTDEDGSYGGPLERPTNPNDDASHVPSEGDFRQDD